MRRDVRDDPALAVCVRIAGLFPALPGGPQEVEQTSVVDLAQCVVAVRLGRHQPRALLDQRLPDPQRALGHLVTRDRQPDPDLAARLVQQACVAPDDGKGERHRRRAYPVSIAAWRLPGRVALACESWACGSVASTPEPPTRSPTCPAWPWAMSRSGATSRNPRRDAAERGPASRRSYRAAVQLSPDRFPEAWPS